MKSNHSLCVKFLNSVSAVLNGIVKNSLSIFWPLLNLCLIYEILDCNHVKLIELGVQSFFDGLNVVSLENILLCLNEFSNSVSFKTPFKDQSQVIPFHTSSLTNSVHDLSESLDVIVDSKSECIIPFLKSLTDQLELINVESLFLRVHFLKLLESRIA